MTDPSAQARGSETLGDEVCAIAGSTLAIAKAIETVAVVLEGQGG